MFQKKFLILLITGLLALIGISTKSVSIQRGKDQNTDTKSLITKTRNLPLNRQDLQNITGTLITSPHLEQTRDQLLQQPTANFKGEIYNITNKQIITNFQQLLEGGTNIEIIMENQQFQQYRNTYKDLQNKFRDYPNFQLKNDFAMKTEYVHAKFFLTDTQAIIQTANLTFAGLNDSIEHIFITTDTGIYHSLKTIWSKDRNGQKIVQTDIHPNLVVCNINCRGVIENLLQNAQQSILIATQYIVDPSILNILASQSQKQTLEIRILHSTSKSNDDIMYFLPPQQFKKYDQEYLHSKTILIDNKILLMGSINLSQNSLDNNREVAILITDPTIIQQYLDRFNIMRTSS